MRASETMEFRRWISTPVEAVDLLIRSLTSGALIAAPAAPPAPVTLDSVVPAGAESVVREFVGAPAVLFVWVGAPEFLSEALALPLYCPRRSPGLSGSFGVWAPGSSDGGATGGGCGVGGGCCTSARFGSLMTVGACPRLAAGMPRIAQSMRRKTM